MLKRVSQIKAVCDRHHVPLAAAAIQFQMAHPIITSVIPGAFQPHHVKENQAYFLSPFPDALWHEFKSKGFIGGIISFELVSD